MIKEKSGVTAELLPLHVYLHRRVRDCPGLTNVQIAEALGYERPNVVAMMLTGSMKVPVAKVPALAKVLEVDPVALLRRVMDAYNPEVWATLEQVIGKGSIATKNEVALLEAIRSLTGHDDLALHSDAVFMADLTSLVLAAHDRYLQVTLATRPGDKARHQNAAMLELFRRQAQERSSLLRSFKGD